MIKQVIVIRRDLNVHKGKIVAQCCHGSIAFLSHHLRDPIANPLSLMDKEWLDGLFTKICVQVMSDEELLDIHKRASEVGLRSILIIDSGLTEFAGIKTNTVVCIGPDESNKIDSITGHLRLY